MASVLALAAAVGLGACSDEGDTESFCEQVRAIPDVEAILSRLDPSDPQGVRAELERGRTAFEDLEKAAPGEVRDDIAVLADAVERILEAVEENPDDPAAVRRDLGARPVDQVGVARAFTELNAFTIEECDLDLLQELRDDEAPSTTG